MTPTVAELWLYYKICDFDSSELSLYYKVCDSDSCWAMVVL